MKVRADCVPCYFKQVINTIRTAGYPEKEAGRIINEVLKIIPDLDPEASPAENSTIVLLEAYRAMGLRDPYEKAKKESNKMAEDLFAKVLAISENSEDKLMTALKISVAGNIIDMGIMPDFDIDEAIGEITARDFDYSDYEEFRAALSVADKVMILGDNSGEIVFDRILVNEIKRFKPGTEVTYVVKDAPILNDVTPRDALETGMDRISRVITNGAGYLGTILHKSPKSFIREIEAADMIIAKGQANYESLEGSTAAGSKTYFLLRIKCPIVAENAGLAFGNIVLIKNRAEDRPG